jgi:excinuclease ABC subunit C
VGTLTKLELLRPPSTDAMVAAMRDRVRADATDRPAGGEVVYVGKSKKLRSRLLSYFRGSFPEDKGARILREAEQIEWDYVPSEFSALLEELRAIKRYRPRFNVAMKRDDRNYCFIKITRHPAAKLAVVRGPGLDDGGVFYGPFMGATRVGESVRELADALGLRDCANEQRMHFADQSDMFADRFPRTPGCIRFEVKKCLGPCVGGCTTQEYAGQVELARAFFDGANDGPIERLRDDIALASEKLEFERAGYLLKKVERLEDLRSQFARMRFAVEALSFVYTVPGVEGDDRVYLIRRGRVRAEVPVPRTEESAAAMLQLIEDVYAPIERDTGRIPSHEIDELLLLSAWFKRFPDELSRTSGGRQMEIA